MQTPNRDKLRLAQQQIGFKNAKKADQLDQIVEGLDALTTPGTPIDPADVEALVDGIVV